MRPSPDITTIASNWSSGNFSTTSWAWKRRVVTGQGCQERTRAAKREAHSQVTSTLHFAALNIGSIFFR